ncbi:MAG: cytochrome c oxidase assembly protein [Gemmatimonadales bacterium]|nr:cytochrome c oxidase assembly protein [Gemmatimonadales bacterium]
MTWWCAATGQPWSWAWRAYPGVWLFIGLLALLYWRFGRTTGGTGSRWFAAGLVLLWLALDWPLGALGGYLASAHTGQYILIALAAPPLLLLGLRDRAAQAGAGAARWLRTLAGPVPAFLGYNLIMLGTHVPEVVDGLMVSQLGSFAIDLLWLIGGLMLWWPVVAPPALQRLSPPLAMAYLFIQTIPAIFPAAFLVFADYPLYRLYELAPRVSDGYTPRYDHQVAGLLMKIVGDPVVWIGIGVVFFRWANAERRKDLAAAGR